MSCRYLLPQQDCPPSPARQEGRINEGARNSFCLRRYFCGLRLAGRRCTAVRDVAAGCCRCWAPSSPAEAAVRTDPPLPAGAAGHLRPGAQQPQAEDPVPPAPEAGAGGDEEGVHGPAEGALPPGAGCAVRAPAAGSPTYAAALTGTALPLRNQVCLRGPHKLAGIDKPGEAL